MSKRNSPPPPPPSHTKSSPKKETDKREIKIEDKRVKDMTKQPLPPITEQSKTPQKESSPKQQPKKAEASTPPPLPPRQQQVVSNNNPTTPPSPQNKQTSSKNQIQDSRKNTEASASNSNANTTSTTERELTVPYVASTRKARSISIGLSHPITFGYAKQKPPSNNTNTNQQKGASASKFSSTTERVMKDVPEPTREVLTMNQVYTKDGKINCDLLKEHFRKEGRIALDVAKRIINTAKDLFKAEPNVLELKTPLNSTHSSHFSHLIF
jgi:hypothetical protein